MSALARLRTWIAQRHKSSAENRGPTVGQGTQQGNLLDPVKVKRGKHEEIDWVLKQKLFDYVPEGECAERQDPTR